MGAFDTSMYQQNPLRSVADYEGDYQKQAMAKQVLQQNALALQTGQMGLQDRQRAIEEQGVVRNALAQLGPNAGDPDRINALKRTGTQTGFAAADALEKALLERESKKALTNKTEVETKGLTQTQEIKAIEFNLQKLSSVRTPQQYAAWLDGGVKSGLMPKEQAMLEMSQIPADPAKLMALIEQQQAAAVDVKERLTLQAAAARDAETAANNLRVDSRVKSEGAANRGVQIRGQNMTDDRARDLNSTVKATAAEAKKLEATDKAVTKFSTELQKEGIPEIEAGLAAAEGVFKRYTDPKTGKLKDMPGIGVVANALPDWAVSSEGRDVRESMSALSNLVLSARSGAAVTDQEMRRLARELSTSVGSSAEDMQRAYRKFRARFETVKANAAAGVSDDVKSIYEERGGVKIQRGGAAPIKPGTDLGDGFTVK